jgi:hypothetical protein
MSDDTQGLGVGNADVGRIIQTFSGLADSLVHEFDLSDLLGRVVREAVRLLPVQGAAILVHRDRGIELAAASDRTVRRLAESELAAGSGPCVDAAGDKDPRSVTDRAVLERTWPSYAAAFAAAGYGTVHAWPMQEREHPVGALNLFSGSASGLSDCELQLGQALADIAALAVVQHDRVYSTARAEQLQHALSSRILVEQAKGVIAEHGGVDMATAFTALRAYARARRTNISAISRAVIDREIHPGEVLEPG